MEKNNDKLLTLHSVNQLIAAIFYVDLVIAIVGFFVGVYFIVSGDLYGRGPILLSVAVGAISFAAFFGGFYNIVNAVCKRKD